STIRWAVATTVIVFPVYVWLSSFLEKELVRYPEKREMKTRKWLIYFTLFAAAGVIMGDLVTLIYNFLEGELTLRFVLKILVVLFVAAVVFRYYLWNLRPELLAGRPLVKKIFGWAVCAVVGAVIVAGFWMAGLPQSQRLRRLDERRVSDLQNIQSQIIYFWQQKNKLPEDMGQLKDSLSGYEAPADLVSGKPYQYGKSGALGFQLCADFSTSSDNPAYGVPPTPKSVPYPPGAYFQDNWSHAQGHICFDRKIDPELYNVKNRTVNPD
ncbi:hypothetical protein HY224_01835, partial [Candidatus Uhrbacteria bacterium]|nr:hypothetical protein [Candidatus Uhrbacteria bacterium]